MASRKIMRLFTFILPLLFVIFSSTLYAKECSQTDILFYLKHGFTHEQVVRLCATTSANKANSKNYATPLTSPPPSSSTSQNTRQNTSEKDQQFFETVINGDSVNLTQETLSFKRKECAVYGDLDMTETRDKVCIRTETTIRLKGLQIIKVAKGLPLLRKQELVVKGDISRTYLNSRSLSNHKMDAIKEQLLKSPAELNIPIKSGINPHNVAERLRKYI